MAARIALKRLGTVDHHEKPAGREHRERSGNPVGERRAGVCGHDMRARFARVGGNPNRPGLEEGRIGDDAIGGFAEPGLAARTRVERVDAQDPRLRLKPVARRVPLCKLRQPGIDLDEIGGKRAQRFASASPTAPTPAPTSTIRPWPTSPAAATRRAASVPDAMAALRLEERERAPEPRILRQSVSRRGGSRFRRPPSHRAVLCRGPLRQ